MMISKKGFTLIELIIVIAIILLMAVVSIPAYQNYGAKSELSLKADEIKALIDRAEAYSRNPQQGNNCAQVTFTSDKIRIQFGGFDTSNPTAGCAIDSVKTSVSSADIVDIASPFSFSTDPAVNYIYSYYPGIVKSPLSSNTNTITLTSSKTGSRHADISINLSPYSTKVNITN